MKSNLCLFFCFLTYDIIEREDIWKIYFDNVPIEHYQILIHPKKDDIYTLEKKTEFFSTFKNAKILKDRYTDTEWGKFSLIEAQKKLLEEALKYNKMTHVILVSHNTIPIASFDKLYNFLLDKKSLFDYEYAESRGHQIRYFYYTDPIYKFDDQLIASQWSIIHKNDVKILVDDHSMVKQIFDESFAPDEHAYINYLIHYKNKKDILSYPVTRIDWENNTPIIFDEVSYELMKKCEEVGNFFLRKISKNSDIDTKNLIYNGNKNIKYTFSEPGSLKKDPASEKNQKQSFDFLSEHFNIKYNINPYAWIVGIIIIYFLILKKN